MIKKAGSAGAVEKIDRDLPVGIARLAFENGVKRIGVVSSLGANPALRNFYLRIKGEMEAGIRAIPFDQIVIARSGGLDGRPSRHGSGAGGAASRGATPSTPTRPLPRSRPRIDCCWVNPSARSRAVPTVRRRAPPRRRRSTRMAAQTTVPDRATPREAGGCRVRGCQRTSAH